MGWSSPSGEHDDAWGVVAASAARGRSRTGLWLRRSLTPGTAIWIDTSTGPELEGAVSAAGWRTRGPGWRIESSLSRTDRPRPGARDPVSSARLGRPLSVWQSYGRARLAGATIEASLRRRVRSGGPRREADQRLTLSAHWAPSRRSDGTPRSSLRAGLRLDEDLDEASTDPSLRLEFERSRSRDRWRLTWARSGPAADAAAAWSISYRRRLERFGLERLDVAAAFAPADRTSAWSVVRPLEGARAYWIPARGRAVWSGLSGRVGRLRFGAWIAWRGPHVNAGPEGGIALRLEHGVVVRRLHEVRSRNPSPG